jgi:hypothetical protein
MTSCLEQRKGDVMKTILGALAVVMLLGAATVTPASAGCIAGPGGVECWHHPHFWHHYGYGYWHHGW